jgi:hypothetical protein
MGNIACAVLNTRSAFERSPVGAGGRVLPRGGRLAPIRLGKRAGSLGELREHSRAFAHPTILGQYLPGAVLIAHHPKEQRYAS